MALFAFGRHSCLCSDVFTGVRLRSFLLPIAWALSRVLKFNFEIFKSFFMLLLESTSASLVQYFWPTVVVVFAIDVLYWDFSRTNLALTRKVYTVSKQIQGQFIIHLVLCVTYLVILTLTRVLWLNHVLVLYFVIHGKIFVLLRFKKIERYKIN